MNNNDQQFNDNNFENFTEEPAQENGSYEYVFSNGTIESDPVSDAPKLEKKTRRSKGVILRVCSAVLCLILAFGAGLGGALCANLMMDDKNVAQTEGEKNLYHEDPESILQKNPSVPSQFGSAGEDVFSVSQVANAVLDTVVVVKATVKTSSFFGESTSVSTGSGVVITPNGYIVTCHHVIENAVEITVTLYPDDSEKEEVYQASLVGSDAASDIALLLVDTEKALPYAGLGNSEDLILGEMVVAVGNPLGQLYRKVTAGYISGLDRNIVTSEGSVMTLLQTDAAVNSGNSGGGLFNLDGELIGIVNAKYAETGVDNVAFAIPIDWAYEVQLDLIEYGYVRGVVDDGLTVAEVNADNYRYYSSYGIKSYGVYVVDSLYCEDLNNKDRIVSINGVEITTEAQLNAVYQSCKVGDVLEIIYSRDGSTHTTTLTLQEYVPDHIKNKQE